jgi:hypothetical protein
MLCHGQRSVYPHGKESKPRRTEPMPAVSVIFGMVKISIIVVTKPLLVVLFFALFQTLTWLIRPDR